MHKNEGKTKLILFSPTYKQFECDSNNSGHINLLLVSPHSVNHCPSAIFRLDDGVDGGEARRRVVSESRVHSEGVDRGQFDGVARPPRLPQLQIEPLHEAPWETAGIDV